MTAFEALQEAIDIQNASNWKGVSLGYAEATRVLHEDAITEATVPEMVRKAACAMYAYKLAQLTLGAEPLTDCGEAYIGAEKLVVAFLAQRGL